MEGEGKGKGKDEGKGKGENCCRNSNVDFHPKFLPSPPPPPPQIVFFILYISLNFTIRASWTWRGLKTIHFKGKC